MNNVSPTLLLELQEALLEHKELPDKVHIPQRVEVFEEIMTKIEQEKDNNLLNLAVIMLKSFIQEECRVALLNAKHGIAVLATGTGKSRIPIMELLTNSGKNHFNVLSVPTQKLRDSNWKEEFDKWKAPFVYEHLNMTCYASLNKIKGKHINYFIADEVHNMTPNSGKFFRENHVERFIGLTATMPSNKEKLQMWKDLGVSIVYNLNLDIATRLKLVSRFRMTIVECPLNNTDKTIEVGPMSGRYMTTEKVAYDLINKEIDFIKYNSTVKNKATYLKFKFLNRVLFMKNLESKRKAAKFITEKLMGSDQSSLFFASSIKQAIEICPYRYFSKPNFSKKDSPEKIAKILKAIEQYEGDKWYNAFLAGEIKYMSCVDAINEGHNLPTIDNIFCTEIDSNSTNILQKIGRGIRFKVGHVTHIILCVTPDTIDNAWQQTALAEFKQEDIRRITFDDLLTGKVTL